MLISKKEKLLKFQQFFNSIYTLLDSNNSKFYSVQFQAELKRLFKATKYTEASCYLISQVFEMILQLSQRIKKEVHAAYIYGSVARGEASAHWTVSEEQLIINDNFIGSLFNKVWREPDLDIELIVTKPFEIYTFINFWLNKQIISGKLSGFWSIRFSDLNYVQSSINDPNRYSLYRNVLKSGIFPLIGKELIESLTNTINLHEASIEKYGYLEKCNLDRFILNTINDKALFIETEIYKNLLPNFYEEWKPKGYKLGAEIIPKLRLPIRSHLTVERNLKSIKELTKILSKVQIISLKDYNAIFK
jgi:predicted nucleotidyltransferase